MDIILMVRREVVVHDMRNTVDVDATRGDVGSHEDTDLALAEFIKGTQALVLRSIGVNRPRRDTRLLKASGDAVGPVLGPSEDKHLIERAVL